MPVTLYGIPNCDTVRKARKWLDAHAVKFSFHDFRKQGLDEEQLRRWVKELGWQVLLNTRGMMWRKLPDSKKQHVDEPKAIKLMLAEPAMIKRPVLDLGKSRHVGFNEQTYKELF